MYTSQEEVGTAYVGKMNILGAYSDDGKAVINFDGHNGFVLSSGTNFNIDGTGVSSGSITAVSQGDNPDGNSQDDVFTANGAYEISGGIENVDFEGQVYAGSGSGAVNINTISFANSNIAQIKDSTFSGNSFSYTNSDTVYSDPVMSARAFLMSNSSIGQKFVGEDGNEYHVGGLYNVKFSDNVNSNSNLSDTVEPYSPTLALASKSYIANIINSEFVGNKVEDYNKAYGVAISLNNSTIHNISNTLFKTPRSSSF